MSIDLKKFASRKLLVAVGTIAVKVFFPETDDSVIMLAATYVGAEGAADIVGASKGAVKESKEAVEAGRAVVKKVRGR